jgi:excisionase family DNA binding protein
MAREFLRAREVAERLDVSLRTVWAWTAAGRLPPPFRMGRVTRWRSSEIEAYVAARQSRFPPRKPA